MTVEEISVSNWRTHTSCKGSPEEVLGLLTEPDAIARWSPIPFEVLDFDRQRLRCGDRVRVRGSLAGRGVEFLVDVTQARDGRLALTASGPVQIDVEYEAVPFQDGCDIHASIGVMGRGMIGRVLAHATEAMLAAGALRASLSRIARELEPSGLACA